MGVGFSFFFSFFLVNHIKSESIRCLLLVRTIGLQLSIFFSVDSHHVHVFDVVRSLIAIFGHNSRMTLVPFSCRYLYPRYVT